LATNGDVQCPVRHGKLRGSAAPLLPRVVEKKRPTWIEVSLATGAVVTGESVRPTPGYR
jgi:hypothetical protein